MSWLNFRNSGLFWRWMLSHFLPGSNLLDCDMSDIANAKVWDSGDLKCMERGCVETWYSASCKQWQSMIWTIQNAAATLLDYDVSRNPMPKGPAIRLCELDRKGTLRHLRVVSNYRCGELIFSTHPAPDSHGFDFDKRGNLEKDSVCASRNLNDWEYYLWTFVVDIDQISKYPCPMKFKSTDFLNLLLWNFQTCRNPAAPNLDADSLKLSHINNFNVQGIQSQNIPIRWICYHPDLLSFFLEIFRHVDVKQL